MYYLFHDNEKAVSWNTPADAGGSDGSSVMGPVLSTDMLSQAGFFSPREEGQVRKVVPPEEAYVLMVESLEPECKRVGMCFRKAPSGITKMNDYHDANPLAKALHFDVAHIDNHQRYELVIGE